MKYRPDIDGLRAISVMAVVLHHLLPGAIPGGFLGVDVFFVISGYLICALLLKEVSTGAFSFSRFYERRIKRLFPAYAACVLVSLAAGYFLLLPKDYHSLAVSGVFGAASLTNVYFASKTGYFDPDMSHHPLLHTWSLAVEEQFYLIFPALLLLLFRFGGKIIGSVLTLLLVASFYHGTQQALEGIGSVYFILWGRAWEMLAGALLALAALRILPMPGRKLASLMGFAGLALIFGGFALVNPSSLHPGPATLGAVIGALLILAAGRNESSLGLPSRLLSIAPLVGVGMISYSLYLWHQPMISFWYAWTGAAVSSSEALVMLPLILLAGWASWRFIETPLRHAKARPTRTVAIFAFASLSMAALSFGIAATSGLPERVPAKVAELAKYNHPLKDISRKCHISRAEFSEFDDFSLKSRCLHGSAPSNPADEVILWGDSHGASLASGILAAGSSTPIRQVTVSGCQPWVGIERPEWGSDCSDMQARFLSEILASEASTVVLVGQWSENHHVPASSEERIDAITKVVDLLSAAGKSVFVVDPTPEFDRLVPSWAAHEEWINGSKRAPVGFDSSEYDNRHKAVIDLFKALAFEGRVTRIPVRNFFCDTKAAPAKCVGEAGGRVLFYDDDHASVEGATPIAKTLLEALDVSEPGTP